MAYIAVMIGGLAGTWVRYLIGLGWEWNGTDNLPLATLLINLTGSLAMGFLMTMVLEGIIRNPLWLFGLGTGFLGAYTTYSTFAYEMTRLVELGKGEWALIYVILSSGGGLIAAWGGMSIARYITSRN